MPISRARSFTASLLLLLTMTSCVTFEAGDTPRLERWPLESSSHKWLHASIEGLPAKFERQWSRGVEQELKDSERFKGVELMTAASSPFAPADVGLTMDFEHARQDLWTTRIWMGVCAMSATIIPARTVQYFDVQAKFSDGQGNQLGVIKRSVSASTWVGILTLFVTPFEGAGHGEMIRNTTRSILVEAAEKGWI